MKEWIAEWRFWLRANIKWAAGKILWRPKRLFRRVFGPWRVLRIKTSHPVSPYEFPSGRVKIENMATEDKSLAARIGR